MPVARSPANGGRAMGDSNPRSECSFARGIPPHIVARIDGHSTITLSLAAYAKVVGSTMDDQAGAIDAHLVRPDLAGNASS
jgi:hypothetical protein